MQTTSTEPSANLVEVFSSVQGEGPEVGRSTLFVRFGGCDLRCRWCDSPHTWQPAERCRLESARGSGEFEEVGNPIPLSRVIEAARALDVGAHGFVSFTGGEPLLQPEAVRRLADALRGLGPAIHLETHGLHREALAHVLPVVDHVSMDWKLASDVRREAEARGTRAAPFHEDHAAFLALARSAARVVVKLVLTNATEEEEVLEAARRVGKGAPEATLLLQPVTPHGPVRERPPAERLLAWARRCETLVADVRLVPQTHPIYGAP